MGIKTEEKVDPKVELKTEIKTENPKVEEVKEEVKTVDPLLTILERLDRYEAKIAEIEKGSKKENEKKKTDVEKDKDALKNELKKEIFIEDMDKDFKEFLTKRNIDIDSSSFDMLKTLKGIYNEFKEVSTKNAVKVEEKRVDKKTPNPNDTKKNENESEIQKLKSLFYLTGRV